MKEHLAPKTRKGRTFLTARFLTVTAEVNLI
jgi:hypothetical protein